MQSKLNRKDRNYREGVWKLVCYGVKEDNLAWSIIKPKKDEKLVLILKNMSLKILNGNVLDESFSFLWHDVKRIVNDKDSMGMVIEHEGVKKRFFRFKFSGTMLVSSEDVCKQCAETLSHYVVCNPTNKDDHTAAEKPDKISLPQYVSEYLKDTKEFSSKRIEELESIDSIEEIIDDCILDVNFPDFVMKIHQFLDSKLNMKQN